MREGMCKAVLAMSNGSRPPAVMMRLSFLIQTTKIQTNVLLWFYSLSFIILYKLWDLSPSSINPLDFLIFREAWNRAPLFRFIYILNFLRYSTFKYCFLQWKWGDGGAVRPFWQNYFRLRNLVNYSNVERINTLSVCSFEVCVCVRDSWEVPCIGLPHNVIVNNQVAFRCVFV